MRQTWGDDHQCIRVPGHHEAEASQDGLRLLCIRGGGWWTLKENRREAFSRILFRPRILIDVSTIDMTTSVLGMKISMPIMISPPPFRRWLTLKTLSSWATSSVEGIGLDWARIRFFPALRKRHPSHLPCSCQADRSMHDDDGCFDLQVYKNRKVVAQLVKRAEGRVQGHRAHRRHPAPRPPRSRHQEQVRAAAGPHAQELRASTSAPWTRLMIPGWRRTSPAKSTTLSWKDVKWLQSITTMPILVKGVITAEDARLAVHSGAAGIIVSNHGARQLDYVPATISALEEVVTAAQGRIGVPRRRRPPQHRRLQGARPRRLRRLHWAAGGVRAGGGGRAGVRNVLRMMREEEFELTMALGGCTKLSDITREHIFTGATASDARCRGCDQEPTTRRAHRRLDARPGICMLASIHRNATQRTQ
ncbi:hypothetical protein ZWY2020_017953 [Hordeum vulgare]|nr:hypothetical protein ZWY2020_017953 [Hordeum vulgare]